MAEEDITVLLDEKRIFRPSEDFINKTNVKQWMDRQGIKTYDELLEKAKNFEWFWEEMAKEYLNFYEPYEKILEWNAPWAKWFINAKYNIVNDAIDKHAKGPNKDKIAFYFEGELGDNKTLTYHELYIAVNKLANAMKKLGIKKGDRVGIYMPMLLELPIAMLATAKLGAIHSVVFSGFSANAFKDRVNDCEAKLVITCDSFYRRGKKVQLKLQSDEAVKDTPTVEHVIVYKRTGDEVNWTEGRDLWWDEITENESEECETEKTDANDPLFFLYTSGTTGKPKGIIHAHAGYAVGTAATLSWVFDIKDDDIYWCAADIGWITGHSYIVYAPLILGSSSLIYEGAPDFPNRDRWWEIIEKYRVSILYTSPTSVRLFMKFGEEWPQKHNLSSLRLLGSVGEPINPEAWMWYYKYIGNEKCQIMDTWWQTETGHFAITPLPITVLKPGTATKPFPGVSADVFNDKGLPVSNAGGNLVITQPWPGMLQGIYKNPERYQDTYWNKFDGIYLAGDVTRKDSDGYFWIQGRADDVLNVSGHRIGNSEVESALVSHPLVVEAAVIGKPHELKGESICAYVVLARETNPNDELKQILRSFVGDEIGKIARPDEIWFVNDVPKKKKKKIMRRVIRSKALGKDVGDISTLANPEAVEEIDKAK